MYSLKNTGILNDHLLHIVDIKDIILYERTQHSIYGDEWAVCQGAKADLFSLGDTDIK